MSNRSSAPVLRHVPAPVRALIPPLTALVVACGGAGSTETTTTPLRPTPEPGPTMPHLSPGSCGGLMSRRVDHHVPLLSDRQRIDWPQGSEGGAMPAASIMSAAPQERYVSRRIVMAEGRPVFAAAAYEVFAQQPQTHDAMARQLPGHHVWFDRNAGHHRMLTAAPRELDLDGGEVEVLRVYAPSADGLVQQIIFVTTAEVAREGGCEMFALHLARTLREGARVELPSDGPRTLFGDVAIDVPDGGRVKVDAGHDFSVYRVVLPHRLGAPSAELGIYVGGHPSFRPPRAAAAATLNMLGEEVEWFRTQRDDQWRGQGLLRTSSAFFHAFIVADSEALRVRAEATLGTLRHETLARREPNCDAQPSVDAVTLPQDVLSEPDVQSLLTASRWSRLPVTLDPEGEPAPAAWQRLRAHPAAREIAAHAARTGTTAGRIYGLALLQAVSPQTFEPLYCEVRGALTGELVDQGACGPESAPAPVATLVRQPEGFDGEPFWTEREWFVALARADADLIGGGLARSLGMDQATSGRLLQIQHSTGGDGYAAPTEATYEAGPSAAGRVWLSRRSSACAERRDGRVVCWGDAVGGGPPTVMPLRSPRAMVLGGSTGCALDAQGRRTCWGVARDFRQRAELCGEAAPSGALVYRSFPDEPPFRALGEAGDTCGVREEGQLWCFRTHRRFAPTWADFGDRIGLASAYRVPLPDPVTDPGAAVVGLATGFRGAGLAWTRDGRVFSWTTRRAPALVTRFDGLARVIGATRGGVLAQLEDGRVISPAGVAPWEGQSAPRDGEPRPEPREVTALRGADVVLSDNHGCARMPDRSVRCWGSGDGAGIPTRHVDEPTDVAALRRAERLFVSDGRTCGLFRRGARLRCVGTSRAAYHPTVGNEDAPEAVDVPLQTLARRAE